MENKNIIIALIVIIAVLGLVIGVMYSQSVNAKKPTEVKITSNNTLHEGDSFSVKLTDLNKTPLSKEKVNVTIKNSKGKIVVNKTVKTNSKGNAKLDLDLKKGKYNVSVSYAGNENYTASNATQKLTIKQEEKAAESAPETSQSEESYSSNDGSDSVDYNSRNSKYFKSDADGSYHEMQEGGHYVYAQDAITGEWSYWADKSK